MPDGAATGPSRPGVQDLCDFLVGEPLDVAQHDDDAPLLAEIRDGAMERLLELAPLERLVRPRAGIGSFASASSPWRASRRSLPARRLRQSREAIV